MATVHLPRLACALAAAAGLAAAPAEGTWSIILVDTRTGEIAVGSATCLTNFDLRAGTPVLVTGVGAATAQSFVDATGQNRILVRDHLLYRTPPEEILNLLAAFDSGHQTRQYGIADVQGRAATFSGTGAGAWAGGQTGRIGDIVYAVQGNVLTGEPVVAAAVDAIIATPGDLAEKLMASMEAARLMGGDGRCSCAPSDPTGCGAPPPMFTKSAHIAYMLIAREGDRDGCTGIYRGGTAPRGAAVADFTGDGLPDVAMANSSSGSVTIFRNTTPGDSPFPLVTAQGNLTVGASPRDVEAADLNGDGLSDIATPSAGADAVTVQFGLAAGGFGGRLDLPVGDSPVALAIDDFNGGGGADIAAANNLGDSVSVLLGDGAGGFAAGATIAVADGPSAVLPAHFDADGDTDLIVPCPGAGLIAVLLGDGDGAFTRSGDIATAAPPNTAAAGDLDGDGDLDLVVGSQSPRQVEVLRRTPAGYESAVFPLTAIPSDAHVTDIDEDGDLDGVVLAGGRLLVFLGDGTGALAQPLEHTIGGSGLRMTLDDLDGDGLRDAAVAAGNGLLIVQNLGGGRFNDGLGCATGDYYMNFNIAFQSASAPDPVLQLRTLFDGWRTDLIGRPDAVLSSAEIDPPRLVADGQSAATMTIDLRDWRGVAVVAPVVSLTVEHAPGSDGLSAIGPVTPLGGGRYQVTLTAGDETGTDRFLITADDGVRPVALMPAPVLRLTVDPDFDGDGTITLADFVVFRNAFVAGDLRADLDGDGTLTIADFDLLRDAFR